MYENEAQFNILNQTIKTRLIGFEIIKKEKNSCIIENITEPSSEQFDNILKKIFLSIHDLFATTEKRCQHPSSIHDIEELEERIQKYDNFCRRVISKSLAGKNSELLWAFLAILIHAQRELYSLNKALKQPVQKATLLLLKETSSIFALLARAYTEKNISIIAAIHEREKTLIYKKAYALLSGSKEPIIIHHLANSIRQFYLATSPLLGLILS